MVKEGDTKAGRRSRLRNANRGGTAAVEAHPSGA